jgi:hypothetical protein
MYSAVFLSFYNTFCYFFYLFIEDSLPLKFCGYISLHLIYIHVTFQNVLKLLNMFLKMSLQIAPKM